MSGENTSLKALPGHLYVVGTPIGNLADLSQRAIAILSEVDLVACEDTRVTGKLLSLLGTKRPLLSYRDHNEQRASAELLEKLQGGASIALVSDAGTPAISDPGFRIVRACRKTGIPVVPVPGPSAFVTLLGASGLPTDSFFFKGFLTPKSAARKRFLQENIHFSSTIVLYESCHRIEKLLAEAEEILGSERVVCLGRELTKKHETILTGTLATIRNALETSSKKGEFVLLLAPADYEL